MEIACVSDVHGYHHGVIELRNYLIESETKHVFLLGDYSSGIKNYLPNKLDLDFILNELKPIARIWGMPGNCDDPNLVDVLKDHDANLHETILELEGISFVGFGGSNPTPMGTPFEFTEEQIYEKLNPLMKKAKEPVVMITHFPPKDTKCDVVPGYGNAGSASLRKIIEEHKPKLVICSHIHEGEGQVDFIGETKIINVGSLDHGNMVLIDTEKVDAEHERLEEL